MPTKLICLPNSFKNSAILPSLIFIIPVLYCTLYYIIYTPRIPYDLRITPSLRVMRQIPSKRINQFHWIFQLTFKHPPRVFYRFFYSVRRTNWISLIYDCYTLHVFEFVFPGGPAPTRRIDFISNRGVSINRRRSFPPLFPY